MVKGGRERVEMSSVTATRDHTPDHDDATLALGGARADVEPSVARGATVGRYVILDELGAGGMGEVFSAYDPELDRRIALKLVKPVAPERSGKARKRLLREAQALAKLSHPNVVTVYDVGTHGERVFIAMEHVQGQTMHQWITQAPGDALNWREGLQLMLQAGRGLAAAHAEGLVHRDFKPSNVMVTSDGQVRVLDFGLARRSGGAEDSDVGEPPSDAVVEAPKRLAAQATRSLDWFAPLTEAGMVMGTPGYMAPEQLAGTNVDARSDQFAFCVVLYLVLFGVRPFPGENQAELKAAMSSGTLQEPPWAARVPGGVRQALRRGLEADPAARHPTMSALLAELERAAGGGRRWVRLGVVAGSLLLGIASVAMLATTDTREPCRGAQTKLEGVWDEPIQAEVARAFAETEAVFADDAREGVNRALGAYASRWVDVHTSICEATRVRGHQSEALMDLRIGCLDAGLRELGALTTVLADADVEVVEHAIEASRSLSAPDECATLEADAADALQIGGPDVESARERIARARAQGLAGKYDQGIAEGRVARSEAERTGHESILAEAALVLAELYERNASFEQALASYEEALHAAAGSGHTRIEVQALIGLQSIRGTHLRDPDSAFRYARHAEAVLRRLGPAPDLQAAIALYGGTTHLSEGRFEAASEEYQRAIRLSEGVPTAEGVHLSGLHNLAVAQARQGHWGDAVDTFLRVVNLTESRLGPAHPTVGSHHLGLGVAYGGLEDYERASHHILRALEIYERTLRPHHPELGRAHHNLGMVQSSLGNFSAAHASYLEAVRIKTLASGPDHPSLAMSANDLGDTLVQLGRPEEALPHLADALRIWTQAHGENDPRNIVALLNLAEAHLALGRSSDAEPFALRALRLAEADETEPLDLARARFVAARALWHATGARREARVLATQAKQAYEETQPASTEAIEAIEAFLADLT
jgi:eukaryotic-like serine/threonine-protein kinase